MCGFMDLDQINNFFLKSWIFLHKSARFSDDFLFSLVASSLSGFLFALSLSKHDAATPTRSLTAINLKF